MTEGFLMKRWTVTALGMSSEVNAATRGRALADCWRSDAFSNYSFRDFLRIARCARASDPSGWGAPITVEGKPAFYLGHNRAYVQCCFPGSTITSNAHPYDVLPIECRPLEYQDRAAAHG